MRTPLFKNGVTPYELGVESKARHLLASLNELLQFSQRALSGLCAAHFRGGRWSYRHAYGLSVRPGVGVQGI